MSSVWQNYIVYRKQEQYAVRGSVDGVDVHLSSSGSDALQHALDLSAGGGEVQVQPGEFVLDTPLALSPNVRLRGSGRGSVLLVTPQAGTGIVGNRAHGASICDLSVISSTQGVAARGVSLHGCGNAVIDDIFVSGFAAYGIWLGESSFLCRVSNCHLAGNVEANLRLDNLQVGEYGDFLPNLVSGCTIFGGGKGIETVHSIVVNLVGCQVYQTNGPAFHIHTESNSVLVSGCRTFQIMGNALVVEDTDEFNLSSNVLCWHTGHGVVIRRAKWGALVGNEIIDTGSYNTGVAQPHGRFEELPANFEPCFAIALDDVCGYSVVGNTLFNWPVCPPMKSGIMENELCFKNLIANNNINYYKEAAISSCGRETVIEGNAEYGEAPHQNRSELHGFMQTFVPERTQRFIDLLRNSRRREA